MIGHLKAIHDNIKDWLKFAEAKNAVLVALCGGGIWGGVKSLSYLDGHWATIYLAFAVSLLALSLPRERSATSSTTKSLSGWSRRSRVSPTPTLLLLLRIGLPLRLPWSQVKQTMES